ncbi:MAG: histidine--tRNA ligase [Synergistaceae bacterium]|jgi:histidyl-tRNA synthetase|nr:histidine--tRNA ligase [Synergistaceae bacterium]
METTGMMEAAGAAEAQNKAPRGVRDILPEESWKWAYVSNTVARTMADFGYSEVHLPIFEHTELFSRGVGDTTDIVEKEMYTFVDRGGRSVTLRPEATAGMVRAALEHSLCGQNAAGKLWCWGPMFRYERPQKGRYRQFYQFDAECLGLAGPVADVEVIALSAEIFRRLGLRNLEVVMNSVGCPNCRPRYRKVLIDYFTSKKDVLCGSCIDRLDRNPLRVLDCKVSGCGAVADSAPAIYEHLCDECSAHFEEVKAGLARLGFPYKLDKRLVRGLDYYTKTAYEILSGDLGAQNAVCGGGRYDNLAESIGGPHLPGVGFAAGFDRVVLVMEQQGNSFGRRPQTQVYVAAQDDAARGAVQIFTHKLRQEGISAEQDAGDASRGTRSFKAQMKSANKAGVPWTCIIGGDELAKNLVAVKNMTSGEQVSLPPEEAAAYIRRYIG